MTVQRVYTKNAAYQKFEVLKTNRNKRYRYHEFLVEGVRNINQAIQNGWRIKSFLYTFEKPLSSWAADLTRSIPTEVNFEMTASLLSELSGKEDTSELMLVVAMRDDSDAWFPDSKNPVLALFDRPSNKGNLGTLLRSCDAFGVDGLIITGHAVDIYEPDVVSSSMGSFFRVPFLRLSDNSEIDGYLSMLRSKFPALKVLGTTAHKQTNLYEADLTSPVLFLIGNETDGLNQHLCEICDSMVTIPMSETSSASSLNVGCAATVLFYETIRQRSPLSRPTV